MALTKKYLIEKGSADKEYMDVDYRRDIIWVGRSRVCEWKETGAGEGQALMQIDNCVKEGIFNGPEIQAAVLQAMEQTRQQYQ